MIDVYDVYYKIEFEVLISTQGITCIQVFNFKYVYIVIILNLKIIILKLTVLYCEKLLKFLITYFYNYF